MTESPVRTGTRSSLPGRKPISPTVNPVLRCMCRLTLVIYIVIIHVHHSHHTFTLGIAPDLVLPGQKNISSHPNATAHHNHHSFTVDLSPDLIPPGKKSISSSPNDIVSVRLLLYYMKFEENTKHSIQYYKNGIARTCHFLLKEDGRFRVSAVGDQDFVASVRNCESIETPSHSNHSLSDLKFDREAGIPESLRCARKGGKGLMQKSVLKIWLNKINVLCIVASKYPDDLTIILDAAAPSRLLRSTLNHALPRITESMQDFHGLSIPVYPSRLPRRIVFARPECNRAYMPKFAEAHFMAVRGRDCPAVESIFSWGLHDFLRGKCNCYDEEMIISHTMTKHPEMFNTYYTGY